MAVPAVIVFTFFAGLFALDGVWLLKRRGYMSFVTSRWGAVWRMLDLVHMWRMRFADGFFLVIVVVAVVFVSFRGGQRSSCSDLNAVHGGDVCVPNGICMVCDGEVVCKDITLDCVVSLGKSVDSSSLGWILLDLSKSHDYGAGFDKFLGRTVRMFVDGIFIGDAVIPEDFFETYKVCVCVGDVFGIKNRTVSYDFVVNMCRDKCGVKGRVSE